MIISAAKHLDHFANHDNSGFNLALLVSFIGLAFSWFNFWYVMERKGTLIVYPPTSFGYMQSIQDGIIVRLPLVFEATGAKPKVIRNLRLILLDFPDSEPILWSATRDDMLPSAEGRVDEPAGFAVPNRTALEPLIEFRGKFTGYGETRINLKFRLEGIVGQKNKWKNLVEFTLYTKEISDSGILRAYGNNNPDEALNN